MQRAPAGPQGLTGHAQRATSVEDAGGERCLFAHKSRMQFNWVKIQQSMKTLQFQRCKFMV